MPQGGFKILSRRAGDGCVTGGGIIREGVVTDIEFRDVDVDAQRRQLVQEVVEPSRIVRILRLQMSLQTDHVQLDPGILQIGDKL